MHLHPLNPPLDSNIYFHPPKGNIADPWLHAFLRGTWYNSLFNVGCVVLSASNLLWSVSSLPSLVQSYQWWCSYMEGTLSEWVNNSKKRYWNFAIRILSTGAVVAPVLLAKLCSCGFTPQTNTVHLELQHVKWNLSKATALGPNVRVLISNCLNFRGSMTVITACCNKKHSNNCCWEIMNHHYHNPASSQISPFP